MAAVQSMTGFARADGQAGGQPFSWELRSVNGKGMEFRLRLPPGMDRIEPLVRQAVQKRFARGNIQATLTIPPRAGAASPMVNAALLAELAAIARRLQAEFDLPAASPDGLLALRGVIEQQDALESDDEKAERELALLAVLDSALASLEAARLAEGAALSALLLGHVGQIEALTARAEIDSSRDPVVIKARLAEQVRLLLDAAPALDECRLAMEAAFLATKADIREELDRLSAHCAAARALLANGGAAGRKLDFLAQEFIRESNTLCSKSNAAAITAIGLELKAVVDQFREQVQNLE